MIERQIDIPAKDGRITTFIVHPERDGPHPVLLFYMDAPGIREELRDMARRFATVGYYVMLPNLYYRAGVMEGKERKKKEWRGREKGKQRRPSSSKVNIIRVYRI